MTSKLSLRFTKNSPQKIEYGVSSGEENILLMPGVKSFLLWLSNLFSSPYIMYILVCGLRSCHFFGPESTLNGKVGKTLQTSFKELLSKLI